eukprot:Nitzschia sp. Nitz4//scaffold36_size144017//54578//55865//NITZ4_003085-RA/size144017-processed-gene-0.41-mRNA-1//1//CDS//3329549453//1644//frame0
MCVVGRRQLAVGISSSCGGSGGSHQIHNSPALSTKYGLGMIACSQSKLGDTLVILSLLFVFAQITLGFYLHQISLDFEAPFIKRGVIAVGNSTTKVLKLDEPIVQELQRAGISVSNLTVDTLASIPSWSTILSALGGSSPHIIGLDQCQSFQSAFPSGPRYLGVSGMFNSGTNVLSAMLQENCDIGESSEDGEVLWQVPWGKHGYAWQRDTQTAEDYDEYNKTRVLPVVIVRSPYDIFESLCRNAYTVNYPEDVDSVCPHVVDPKTGELLPVEVGRKRPRPTFSSVVHYWNTWYWEYYRKFPHFRLMVRHEDLTVRPQETIRAVCECAGGTMVDESDFVYVLNSAKAGMGHGKASESNGLVQAWARLGRKVPFPRLDYEAIRTHLNATLMSAFHYPHPERLE